MPTQSKLSRFDRRISALERQINRKRAEIEDMHAATVDTREAEGAMQNLLNRFRRLLEDRAQVADELGHHGKRRST